MEINFAFNFRIVPFLRPFPVSHLPLPGFQPLDTAASWSRNLRTLAGNSSYFLTRLIQIFLNNSLVPNWTWSAALPSSTADTLRLIIQRSNRLTAGANRFLFFVYFFFFRLNFKLRKISVRHQSRFDGRFIVERTRGIDSYKWLSEIDLIVESLHLPDVKVKKRLPRLKETNVKLSGRERERLTACWASKFRRVWNAYSSKWRHAVARFRRCSRSPRVWTRWHGFAVINIAKVKTLRKFGAFTVVNEVYCTRAYM